MDLLSLSLNGLILRDMGNLEQAATVLKRVLALCCHVLGEEHITTANNYSNMASVYHHQGHVESAIAHQEQAYRIYLNVFGSRHQWTNTKLNYLNELRNLQVG
ncbi:tetratricopeptide repeat protein [Chloroflexi bacterium TSY]|nr:tetratricopeptide repeat protein [Chloroflexi bacterium TSY]